MTRPVIQNLVKGAAAADREMRQMVSGKVIQLTFDKETRGAVRFVEVDDNGNPRVSDADGAVVSYMYLRKRMLKDVFGTNCVPVGMTVRLSIE